jgi:hypothetical protein
MLQEKQLYLHLLSFKSAEDIAIKEAEVARA